VVEDIEPVLLVLVVGDVEDALDDGLLYVEDVVVEDEADGLLVVEEDADGLVDALEDDDGLL